MQTSSKDNKAYNYKCVEMKRQNNFNERLFEVLTLLGQCPRTSVARVTLETETKVCLMGAGLPVSTMD